MPSRIRDKSSALKATRVAQAVAVVLALVAGVIGIFGLGMEIERRQPPTPTVPDAGQPGDGQAARPQTPAVDFETIDANFSYLANAPQAPAEVEVAVEDEPDPTPQGGLTGRDIRYVGSISSGGRMAAFLNIAGVTKLLRPGGPGYDGIELVSVSDEEVVVSVAGVGEEVIEKAERQGPGVLIATGGAPMPERESPEESAIAGEPPTREFSPDMSREERRAILLERAREERAEWQRRRGENGGPSN